jgi:hypothetical protein
MKVRGQDLKHPWAYGIAAIFFLFSLVDAAGDHPLGGSVRAAQVVIATMILYGWWQQPTTSPWASGWVRFGLAALLNASIGILIILRTLLHWSSRSTGANMLALGAGMLVLAFAAFLVFAGTRTEHRRNKPERPDSDAPNEVRPM